MSTAARVPETYELTGDEAYETLRAARLRTVASDAFRRFRYADGFSHSRAMAFQLVMTLLSGAIALIGLAVTIGSSTLANALTEGSRSFAPGPTTELFEDALMESSMNGHAVSALIFGSIAMLIAGSSAMGQVERAANRIYGVEADRPPIEKYRRALLLTLTAGVLSVIYVLLFTAGDRNSGDATLSWLNVWLLLRWPVTVTLLTVSICLIFELAPRRHQPRFSWLAVGAALSVIGSVLVSALLGFYIALSKSFGQTYGPLAGFMGVLLWAYLSSITLFYGLAFAAQLEAVRGGVSEPRSEAKLRQGEPLSGSPLESTGKF
jgi:YihY family inner membrane protein